MADTASQPDRQCELQHALADRQFFLVYQPVFDLRTGRMTSAEALIRWRHPRYGIIPPARFIPDAEELGLIVPIGRWVLRTACTQAAAWRRHQPIGVSVNLSARQFDDDALFADVADALERSGLDGDALTLELTETAIMRDVERAVRTMRELKQLGVHIALDDFGTGYSSLAHLARFPIDAIKIDRSFMCSDSPPGEARALIHMIVELGKLLGLETLGEGIENETQLRRLQGLDCDYGQGYLLARPLDPHVIDAMLDPEIDGPNDTAIDIGDLPALMVGEGVSRA